MIRGQTFFPSICPSVKTTSSAALSVISLSGTKPGGAGEFPSDAESLLRAFCTELGMDWEEGLPWLMLAAKEVTQESTGFSPNDLGFAYSVRGPLAVLRDSFKNSDPPQNLIDYMNEFRHRLYVSWEQAREKLAKAQGKMKHIYDQRAE